jgi:hypothetical protein
MTTRWDTAKEAANAAHRLPHVWGCRARFEPDLTPAPGDDPWPVSTHTVIRVEAWAVDSLDGWHVKDLERALATLPGASGHGHVTTESPECDPDREARRPHAWVLLRQDEGSFCDHTRERWNKGAVL